FTAMIAGKLLTPRLGAGAASLFDPLGYTSLAALMPSLTPLQKNTFVLVLDQTLLTSRLVWLGIATAVMAAVYARFRFAHQAAGRGATTLQSKPQQPSDSSSNVAPAAVPVARRRFDASTRLRQLRAITMRSFRELHTSRAWSIVPLLALLFVLQAPQLATNEMGVPSRLSAARLTEFLIGDVSILITLLIALSAGELVWRDRAARIHALSGVTPVPDWISVTGKFAALATMLAAALTIFLFAGLAVQTMYGAGRYDLALYLQILYGLLLPEYLLTVALAMLIHVLINQKYVANVLIVLTPFARDLIRSLGVEDNLLLYGSVPPWMHSEISGFGPATEARLWFTLYYGGWALLFALTTYLFWIRGEERDPRQRFGLARRRFTPLATIAGATAFAIIAGAGGFIFYNTHIRHEYTTTAKHEQRRAELERRYGRYASLPQPILTATKLEVEFYPQRRAATIRGTYRFENLTSEKIGTIQVATSSDVDTTTVSFDRASRLTIDDGLDYRIYALDRALEPGESLEMRFGVELETRLFQNQNPPVVRNGSFMTHRPRDGVHWLPVVGYPSPRELDNPGLRKRYGLRERSPYPRLGDRAVGNEQRGYETIQLETTIGTDAGQIGVAPGKTRRMWAENGRQYVHYVTEAPISNAWTLGSANYAVHRAQWRPATGSHPPVEIEIFHDPAHTANLDRMVRGVQASLEHNTKAFGPYRYQHVRLAEFPSPASVGGMTAHSSMMTYAEGFSLLRPQDDARNIDFVFAVVAHEMGHQWWGHQLTPAVVEGAPFLAESLAWYSAMLVIEETLGRDHLQRLLDMMRADYLQPNQPRTVPLLRAIDQVDAYRRGPFAMYALRERVGVQNVNRTLRTLLSKFPPGRTPYPTSLDFYAELRAVTPAPMQTLLKDLFEEITFWELSAQRIDVKPDGQGAYRVTLHVEAEKLKGDKFGMEHPVPMNEPVEILVYDANHKPLYR
ncbi:MAG TPA: M1 family aminopeptidase, partial [Thermoanaerobaculia bacterium]